MSTRHVSSRRRCSASMRRRSPTTLQAFLRETVFHRLRRQRCRRRASPAASTAAWLARWLRKALGPERVLGLMMPEARLVRRQPDARSRAGRHVRHPHRSSRTSATRWLPPGAIGGATRRSAAWCPSTATDGAARSCCPTRSRSRATRSSPSSCSRHPASERRVRLPLDAYLGIVAATNFKQRVRKMMEYHYADRFRYAVAGTPNLLEHDQGFFVKHGDGAADVKPIAHLYKSQVYQLAEYLGVPEEIRQRQADDGHLFARAVAGGVLLRALAGADRPVHLRARPRRSGRGGRADGAASPPIRLRAPSG